MLKKYGKAIEQPQGTLPLHLHSEQMDGQSTESKRSRAGGRQEPCAEWSLALPPEGWGLHSTRSHVFDLDPVPSHQWNVGCRERQSHDNWKVLEAEGDRGHPSRHCLLAVCALGSLASDGEARLPWGGSSLPSLPETSPPSRLSLQSWPQVPKKAMIQDREAEPTGCGIQKRGYGQWDFRNKFNFGFPTFSDHKN